ncbi:MAG: hypothetical protein JJU36_04530 [Phycisphaeraceae bacterium]|nr:hypothetical protein [Phycisphaeraceae bacterium]
MQRDPLGYVDGGNLYAGYFAMLGGVDPMGLTSMAYGYDPPPHGVRAEDWYALSDLARHAGSEHFVTVSAFQEAGTRLGIEPSELARNLSRSYVGHNEPERLQATLAKAREERENAQRVAAERQLAAELAEQKRQRDIQCLKDCPLEKRALRHGVPDRVIPNGCGTEGQGFWQRLGIAGGLMLSENPSGFQSDCDNHDICYGTCGQSQSQCDLAFRRDMLATCDRTYKVLVDRNRRSGVRNHPQEYSYWINCRLAAESFYSAVYFGGADAFWDTQVERCECQRD